MRAIKRYKRLLDAYQRFAPDDLIWISTTSRTGITSNGIGQMIVDRAKAAGVAGERPRLQKGLRRPLASCRRAADSPTDVLRVDQRRTHGRSIHRCRRRTGSDRRSRPIVRLVGPFYMHLLDDKCAVA